MTTTTERYNGWTNYETWNVALWLGNEEGSYRHCQHLAQECWDDAEADATFTRKENARNALADELQEMIEEANPLADQASMYSDVLSNALSGVNWYEIADGYLEDFEDEESEDDDEDE